MHVHRLMMSFLLLIVSLIYSNAHSRVSLLSTEQNTIDVFQQSSPKVVYIQRFINVTKHFKHEQISDGAGSGIVWDKSGHIVTNYHVVRGANHLQVVMGDMSVSAKVIGAEPRKDIAVLAVTAPNALKKIKTLKPFEFAPTKELLVGQKTIAIGNPFGLDHSLTMGVISALDRQFPGVGGVSIHGAIQTDASINPGNSGGPLLDSHGRLIGLNTAIYSQNGSSAGIGFAVPSDDIQHVATQIIQHGRVVLAGIGIERADPKLAEKLGIKKGILIANTLPNTPAAKANLAVTGRDRLGHTHVGDVIVSVNDKPVENYDVFYNMFTEIGVGENIKVTVLRNGKRFNHTMKTIDIAAY